MVTAFDELQQAIAYCAQPAHLRRTLRIALVVGLLLTLINQGAVIAGGDASAATWARCALNFVTPFVVSNLGVATSRPAVAAAEVCAQAGAR